MQGASGKFSPKTYPHSPVNDALPPAGAASRFAIQKPLEPRAADLAVGPVLLEEPVGPAHELQMQRERALCEAEVTRLSVVVAQMDAFTEAAETGADLGSDAGQSASLREDANGLLLYWQAKLNALDARIARGDAVHGRKTPLADAAAGEIVALPANPDPKAQRRLDKKARQVALKSAHREPADRVRQAEASNKPEVAALVAFIVDHFDGRLLPLTDDAWQAIGQWAGFRNLATAAQNLASDFGKLTADQRHATTIFNSVHDRRRERAAAHPAARPKKGEQKEPGPVPANGPGAKADQRRVAQATPVVVHLPEVKTQHPEPAKPQQQLKAMQPTLLGGPALGARDMKGAVVMEAHREWPRAVPRQVVAEGSGAKEELERLQAEYLAQQALLRSLADDMIVREDQLCELEDVKVQYVLNAAKVDQGAQSIHWKATHHPGFAKLEKPLQQLVEISARFEDGFVANRERDSEINRLKERLGWPT